MKFLDSAGLERLWQHILAKLSSKVDTEEGRGLSSNDFTTAEKEKLASLNTVEVDNTLTVSGAAADAKATGDALAGVVKSVNDVAPDEAGNVAIEISGEVDETLTQSGAAADAKVVGDILATKADILTDEDAFEMAAELGLIDPVTDENGAIYTDINGEILSL